LGSDIHLFIEYRVKNNDTARWNSFAGQIELERDYRIFARLAGVRGDLANAIVPPRGFPEDAGPKAKDENLLWIDYTEKEPNPWDSACKPDEAKHWVEMGKSKYFGTFNKIALAVDLKGEKETELVNVQRPERVSKPDWHSHSWLRLGEFKSAIFQVGEEVPKTYAACIAAMRSLEEYGCEVRVVFWFDN
jgi:hypothetical protein